MGIAVIALILNHDQGTILGIENGKFASIFFLGLLVTVIGAGIIPRSGGLKGAARNAAIWLCIISALMFSYVYRYELQDIASRMTAGLIPGSPISTQSLEGRKQVTLIRSNNGHFEARGNVNGKPINFLIDTGASSIVLTYEDAISAGIDVSNLSFVNPVSTANGMTTTARVRLGFLDIGEVRRDDIKAMVSRQGDLGESLLGMSFLGSLSSFEIRGDRLILTD